jgi:pimeloyl-ACP methyl ester carboxylesterase
LAGSVVKTPTPSIMGVLTHMAERNIKGWVWMLWAGLRLLLVDFLPGGKRRAFARRLGDIRVPVLITWGRFDGLLPVRNATEAKALMPGARVRVFGNSAHMPMLEEPEAFEALVREFLHRNRRTNDHQRHAQPAFQRGRTPSDRPRTQRQP